MALEPKDVRVINKFYIDGRSRELGTSDIFYIGYVSSPYDVVIPAEAVDFNIPLENKGVIKKIMITNKSCDPVYFKLNGSSQRFKLEDQLILSQHPTSLLIDNDSEESNVILEILIIGEDE